MKCLEEIFLVEGIKTSSNTKENLNKIANVEINYKHVIFIILKNTKHSPLYGTDKML
jgi:hypothetical protein